MSSAFRRRISPTERLYLSAREVHPHFLIQVVVEGGGALDADKLQHAVEVATRVHPGARLVRSGTDWIARGAVPRVRALANTVLDFDRLTEDAVLGGPISRPDYVSEAPNCEVVLLTADPVTVIFRAFHGVMDAKGLQLWAADVFRVLRGAAPEGALDATTDQELAFRLGIPGSPTSMVPNFRSPIGHGAAIAGRPFLLRHRALPGVSPAIVARIGEIVAAATGSRARLMIPVDLRRHDAELRSTANLTLPLFLDTEPGEGWREINARMLAGLMRRDELNQMKNPGLEQVPAPIAKGIIRTVDKLGRRTGRNLCSAIISHAGKVTLGDFAGPDFTPASLVAIPAHTGLAPLSFAIVESEHATGITVSCRNGKGVAERLEALLDTIAKGLGDAAAEALTSAGPVEAADLEAADEGAVDLEAADLEAADQGAAGHGTADQGAVEPAGIDAETGAGTPALHLDDAELLDPVSAVLDTAEHPRLTGLEATLVELLRAQVAARPDAVAITGPEGSLTYAQVGERSAAIAAALRDHGVRHGETVAILAGRTRAGLTGQWGILETGAAFLPLDPKHPPERIAQVLDDSGVRLCLVERRYAELAEPTVPVLILEELPESGSAPVDVGVEPGDVAYVTYTSGSTGRPKGVRVTHDGVVHYLRAALDWYHLTPGTRYAHYHTPAADMACMAMVSPLIAGGAVVLVPGEINHLTLSDMLGTDGADTLFLTPSLAEVVLRQDIRPVGMRTVVLGGEQLSHDLLRRVREFFGPRVRLVNSYGPTEVSLVCISQILTGVPARDATAVPIGLPAPGTTVYLLDAQGRPVPDGKVGELYLGGPQVAAGYLHRPELTAERFVTVGGERTYRTGDLVRRLGDGTFEFAGRVDDQVKIRGNRVEPDEIRCVLETHPTLAAAAVVGRRRAEHSDHVLDAFVVTAPDVPQGEPGDQELRDFLGARLPVYMIPRAFHRLRVLPLTSNGKTDRLALVRLAEGGSEAAVEVRSDAADGSAIVPEAVPASSYEIVPTPNPNSQPDNGSGADPEDFLHEQVGGIWARILRREPAELTADSDFFALGGDSLATVEMLAQVSRQIVGPAAEQAFVAQVEGLIHHLTLNRVVEAVTVARTGVQR
ncbi:non-ribosomal peptide synthetase [Nocardia sp. NPDC057668]|uniref:non-ribosomal peptide synthetase n=1 Tax=Nocardia sp. NPDC057668 TaxID=3346202 RepID=UPI00366AB7E6